MELVIIMKIEDIWLEYRAALKSFLHSKISNEADVDDLLQDILIKTQTTSIQSKPKKALKLGYFK